ncbi:MAG: formylglycine-generating enzyme family protein [Gammaproteobacteria bacterium]|nr:formylglycine-generating enzyme family protein [Gammaproteobacteria bacterium]
MAILARILCLAIIAALLPTEVTAAAPTTVRDCADCPELVVVPRGRFMMGSDDGEAGRSEGPVHEVKIRAFALARNEVTIAEFRKFVTATGYQVAAGCRVPSDKVVKGERVGWDDRSDASWQTPGFIGPFKEDIPVVCVGHADARAYVAWLSGVSGKAYRLPSEAEWEYAARAGSRGIYPWGNNADLGCAHANAYDRSARRQLDFGWGYADCEDGYAELAPVARFKPNAFGLYDMIGNVWEWTADCYQETYDTTPRDGSAVAGGADCAKWTVRGGGWMTRPSRNRLTFRGRDPVDARYSYFGFRVARDVD